MQNDRESPSKQQADCYNKTKRCRSTLYAQPLYVASICINPSVARMPVWRNVSGVGSSMKQHAINIPVFLGGTAGRL